MDNLKAKWDTQLILVSLSLTLIGVIMVHSSSAFITASRFGNHTYYLYKVLFRAIPGIIAMILMASIDYKKLSGKLSYIVFLTIPVLAITLIPGLSGKGEVNGASRWINFLGVGLQPSEFAKLCFVLFIASHVSKKQMFMESFTKGLLPVLMLMLVFVVLLIMQPNYGMAISFCVITFSMLFVSGAKIKHLAGVALLGLPALLYKLWTSSHSLRRLQSFLYASSDLKDEAYQVDQSLIAFGNGGLFGRGLGLGRQKLFYLPEAHTDFIFSVTGEEFGFIGCCVVISLFVWFIYRGIRVAIRAEDRFGSYLAFGLVTMIGVFMVFNFFVVLKIMPATGIPLPFMSYGGSALTVNMAAVGLLLSISKEVPVKIISDQGQKNEGEQGEQKQKSLSDGSRRNGGTYNSRLRDSRETEREAVSRHSFSGR